MRKVAIIIITIGLFLLASYFLYYYYIDKHEKDEIELYIESTSVVDEQPEEIVVSTEPVDTQEENFWVDYKAVLEIPKINLKKGLVESTNNFRSINYAISIDKKSNYPNEEGNFILYAHSGNSKIAFFRNLNKLDIGDEVIVYYLGTEYHYKIFSKYEIEKTGKLEVLKNNNQRLITLLTCISNTNKQVVLIGKQEKIANY